MTLPPPPMIICINIRDNPESVAEAYWYAKLLNGLGQPERGSDLLYAMGKTVGSWVVSRVPSPGFPWFAVGMKDHQLARTVAELMTGHLYSIRDMESWAFSLSFTSLGEIIDIGPTHHLIGHLRGKGPIGAFTFDPVAEGQELNYPSLWAAEGRNKRTIATGSTHEGSPFSGRESQQRQMLQERSDLFISRTLGMPSQALAAARTAEPVMGGRAWTALQSDDSRLKDALAIWLNSSLSGVIRTCYAQTTQPGRAAMQINALAGFPVPDFAAASPAGEQARRIAQERYGELAALTLEPVSYAFRDENRHQIDSAALAMVGLGDNPAAAQAVAHLRCLWCQEPAVHGGNDAIMRALRLRGPRR